LQAGYKKPSAKVGKESVGNIYSVSWLKPNCKEFIGMDFFVVAKANDYYCSNTVQYDPSSWLKPIPFVAFLSVG